MAQEEKRPSNSRSDADRFQDRLHFLNVAVGMVGEQLADARKRLEHLPLAERLAGEEMREAGRTEGEIGAGADLITAMNGLNFSPDLKNEILRRVDRARTERKGNPPTPPLEH